MDSLTVDKMAAKTVVLMVVLLDASKDEKMAALTAERWELKTVVMKVETTVGSLADETAGMKVVLKVVVMVVLLVVLLAKS